MEDILLDDPEQPVSRQWKQFTGYSGGASLTLEEQLRNLVGRHDTLRKCEQQLLMENFDTCLRDIHYDCVS